MKKVLTTALSVLLIATVVFGADRETKFGAAPIVSGPEMQAASSPWLPLGSALEMSSIYFRGVQSAPGGVAWFYGAAVPAAKMYTYVTKDSGKTFSKQTVPALASTSTSGPRFVLDAYDANNAVIGSFRGEIFRTTNGGAKWDTVWSYDVGSGFFDGIKYVSKDTIVAFGDKTDSVFVVVRSTNGGLNWTRLYNIPRTAHDEGQATNASSIDAFGNNVWFVVDQYGGPALPMMLRSTDAGATWDSTSLPIKGGVTAVACIAFKDASVGYMADVTTNWFYKTTDGGKTWNGDLRVVPFGKDSTKTWVTSIAPVRGTSTVYAYGYDATQSATWKSTDDGLTWTAVTTPAGGTLRHGSFESATIGWAAGNRTAFTFSPSILLTFYANTSTIPDTLKTTSWVQLRGEGTSNLTWGNDSPAKMTNIGGDYWKTQIRVAPNTTVKYKFFTNAKSAVPATGDFFGWEGGGDRFSTVTANDTIFPLQYVCGTENGAQYWRPWGKDSAGMTEVWFRVNMATNENFDKNTMKLQIRGSWATNWDKPIDLKKEPSHVNSQSAAYDGSNFWSGVLYVPTPSAAQTIMYKFTYLDAANAVNWESIADRSFSIDQNTKDTTLAWKWWNNVSAVPPAGTDTLIVTYTTDLAAAIANNSAAQGDTVQVRSGWNNSGASVTIKKMTRAALGTVYSATDTIYKAKIGGQLYYQYYLVKGGVDNRELYYNFNYTGTDQTLAERRSATGAKSMIVFDTAKSVSNKNRMPYWKNQRKLAGVVDVKYEVNLKPAYYQVKYGAVGTKDTLLDIQGVTNIHKGVVDSIYKWGVSINGEATGTWQTWGSTLYADTTRKMYDDGTHGDRVSGDRIYTRVIRIGPDSANRGTVGQVFKFGIRGGDNEGGRGGFGNNHNANVNDATSSTTIYSMWGSINPSYYDQWNYDKDVAGIKEVTTTTPLVYALDQNYPNPFNPSTTISYSIPVNGMVTLRLFNVLGQQVGMLVNDNQNAGKYQVTFDASGYSSGIYFYRIEAGSFSSVKKMMLLK